MCIAHVPLSSMSIERGCRVHLILHRHLNLTWQTQWHFPGDHHATQSSPHLQFCLLGNFSQALPWASPWTQSGSVQFPLLRLSSTPLPFNRCWMFSSCVLPTWEGKNLDKVYLWMFPNSVRIPNPHDVTLILTGMLDSKQQQDFLLKRISKNLSYQHLTPILWSDSQGLGDVWSRHIVLVSCLLVYYYNKIQCFHGGLFISVYSVQGHSTSIHLTLGLITQLNGVEMAELCVTRTDRKSERDKGGVWLALLY